MPQCGRLAVAGAQRTAALQDLTAWFDRLLGPEDWDERTHSRRICDLHQLTLQHYFHPRMGGRTSIKVMLPAVWEFVVTGPNTLS